MCSLHWEHNLLLLKLELPGEERSVKPWNLAKGKSSLVKLLKKQRMGVRTVELSSPQHRKRRQSLKEYNLLLQGLTRL